MMDFNKELTDRTLFIENVIKDNLINITDEKYLQKEIFDAMNYSVLAGGKRLRPMLMLECLRMLGGCDEDAFPFMTAIELVHTYSLVHDDLPAMDNDEYRRGRKTTHIVYGEAMGILAGDALLNYAFEVGLKGVFNSFNKEYAVFALKILADKAGVFGMIGGQVVDIKNDGKNINIDTLNYINELKTGALIEAAMMMGAALAGASDETLDKIEEIASKIGRAFQIKDDILDLTSSQEVIGKPVLSDEKNNKSTYVNLLGIDGAAETVERLTNEAIDMLEKIDGNNEFLVKLIYSLVNRKK